MPGPIIAITMGDAAGIGPEIIMKSLAHADLYERCRPLVIGDARRLEQAGEIVGANLAVKRVQGPGDADFRSGTVDCVDLGLIPADLPWGKLSGVAGNAAYQCIKRATELAVSGAVDAICTAPLNKEALHAGGHAFPGHTELLAHPPRTPEGHGVAEAGREVADVVDPVQAQRVTELERVAPRVAVRATRRVDQRVDGDELGGDRVVVAGAQVHVPGGVGVLPRVPESGHDRAQQGRPGLSGDPVQAVLGT